MIRRLVPALALAVSAARAASPLPPGMVLTADNWESTAQEVIVHGHAQLREAESLFTADEIRYDRVNDAFTAQGHVVFTRGPQRLLADYLVYQRRAGTFTAQNIRLGRPPFFISGRSAEGVANREIVVRGATVSFSEPGRWAPTIKADTIIYSPGHFLRLGSGRAGVGSFQVVPIPHLSQNLVRGAPLFSYLTLGVGYRSTLGGIADLGLRAPVLPDLKVGGDVTLFTSRGIMAGPAADYESAPGAPPMAGSLISGFIQDHGAIGDSSGKSNGFITGRGTLLSFLHGGQVAGDILGRPIPEDRGFLEWLHQQQITDDLDFKGQVNWWNDSAVVRDFRPKEFYPVQEPDSFVESTYVWSDAFASAFARFQPNSFNPVQERLPELRFDVVPTAMGAGFYERFNSGIVRLVERPPEGGPELADNRLDAFYGVSRPIMPADWLTFTPVAGGRVTNYSDTKGAPETGGYTRTLGEVGFDAVMRSSGIYDYQNPLWNIDGIRHLLTPHVSYRYIPEADSGRGHIPQIDRQTFTTYLTPLELGDVRFIDDLRPVNTLRLGLDNTFQTRDPSYGSRDLLTFNVADDLNFKRQPGQKDFSDLHTEQGFTPAPWVDFTADQIVNPRTFTLREFNAGFDLHDDSAWGLRLAGDFLRHEDDDYLLDLFARINEVYRAHLVVEYGARQFRFNEMSLSLEQNLANVWRVQYIMTFNAGPNREGHFGFNAEVDVLRF